MSLTGWRAYDEASDDYFDSYEKLAFAKIHRSLLPFLPSKGANCLDVGAGSGRDSAALAKRGFLVTAVEPSAGLRALAERRHRNQRIRWIDDHLPLLAKIRGMPERYAFILLSAVWMHISPEDRHQALSTLSSLVQKDGCIAITLRLGTPDENRPLYPVDTAELLEGAHQHGLRPIYVSRLTKDPLRRAGVNWQKVVLTKVCEANGAGWSQKKSAIL